MNTQSRKKTVQEELEAENLKADTELKKSLQLVTNMTSVVMAMAVLIVAVKLLVKASIFLLALL